MDDYGIVFVRSARKELEALPADLAARVFERILSLAGDPRRHGAKKLVGSRSLYRLRVGDYRVIYEVDDRALKVDVVAIRHRRDAYR